MSQRRVPLLPCIMEQISMVVKIKFIYFVKVNLMVSLK